ncbi:MAG: aryl-sulfate sulfotransferase, partial [Myxococcales bacterium]|nr:aryl-sulfate sulfotransferase [Myxococcales bacterium]
MNPTRFGPLALAATLGVLLLAPGCSDPPSETLAADTFEVSEDTAIADVLDLVDLGSDRQDSTDDEASLEPDVEDIRDTVEHDFGSVGPDWLDGIESATPVGELSRFELALNPANSLSFFANWETPEPATTAIRVQCDGEEHVTLVDDQLGLQHEVFVMGLWDGVECQAEGVSMTAAREYYTSSGNIVAGPLPSRLAVVRAQTSVAEEVQPGWTLFNISNFWNAQQYAVIVDEQGRYRWYYAETVPIDGETDTSLVDGGVLLGGAGPNSSELAAWDGTRTWRGQFAMHHSIQPYDEDSLIHVSPRETCSFGLESSVIYIRDWESQQASWRWALCEHYEPPELIPDWDHINAAERFPDEPKAVLISVRNQTSLFKINTETDEI